MESKKTLNKILEFLSKTSFNIEIISEDKLILSYSDLELQLNYINIFAVDESKGKIIWSDDNIYMDKKTILVSNIIRLEIEKKTKSSREIINRLNKFLNETNKIEIKGELINILGIITHNIKILNNKYKQYYLITDIINISM